MELRFTSGSAECVFAMKMLVFASSIASTSVRDYFHMHCSFELQAQLLISETLLAPPTLYSDVTIIVSFVVIISLTMEVKS